jgi:hypothetical protein
VAEVAPAGASPAATTAAAKAAANVAEGPALKPARSENRTDRNDAKTEPKLAAVTAPNAPNALLVRASLQNDDRLAEARSAARERPNDPKALKALAGAALRAGELREARRAAEAWAIHEPTAEPRLVLATVLEASGRKREARAVLDEWLVSHPDSTDVKKMRERLGASPEPAIKRSGRSSRTHAETTRETDPGAK